MIQQGDLHNLYNELDVLKEDVKGLQDDIAKISRALVLLNRAVFKGLLNRAVFKGSVSTGFDDDDKV